VRMTKTDGAHLRGFVRTEKSSRWVSERGRLARGAGMQDGVGAARGGVEARA
jgi:hypothetical protein